MVPRPSRISPTVGTSIRSSVILNGSSIQRRAKVGQDRSAVGFRLGRRDGPVSVRVDRRDHGLRDAHAGREIQFKRPDSRRAIDTRVA